MKTREALGGATGFVAGIFAQLDPLIVALLVMIAIDVATGILAAYVNKDISSDATFRGGARKAIILLVVMAGKWISDHFPIGVDLGAAMAAYYAVHEVISILENAASAGVPLPPGLLDSLRKTKATAEKV